jgi:biotin transporter BioY
VYLFTLICHSWLRYAVLGLGIALLVTSLRGWRAGRAWSRVDERLQAAFVGVLDTQMLLGLILYFGLSPLAAAARADLGAAMKIAELRFFGVEHVATMLIALMVAHAGRSRGKRKQGAARQRTTLITQLVWLVLTLVAIPWPALDVGRPWLRY